MAGEWGGECVGDLGLLSRDRTKPRASPRRGRVQVPALGEEPRRAFPSEVRDGAASECIVKEEAVKGVRVEESCGIGRE